MNGPRHVVPFQPPQVYLPQPSPPVSAPGQAPPTMAGDGGGKDYGIQQRAIWPLGKFDARGVLDLRKSEYLWRVSVFGRVLLTITYGTKSTRHITGIRTPMVMTIPGQVIVTAQPLDDQGTTCDVTATLASAGARSICRQLVGADAGAVALDEGAVDFFALVDSSLTISGVVTAVPALAVVPLVAGSSLTSGGGFLEFEA